MAPAARYRQSCCVNEIRLTFPDTFVSAKLAAPANPATVAVTAYAPETPLAVALILAFPFDAVRAVEENNVADAPDPGTVNVTVAPPIGLPEASSTATSRGIENAIKTAAVCGVPLVACIEAAGPADILKLLLCAEAIPAAAALN